MPKATQLVVKTIRVETWGSRNFQMSVCVFNFISLRTVTRYFQLLVLVEINRHIIRV